MATATTQESSKTKRTALYITLGIIGLLAIIGAFVPEARSYVMEAIRGMGGYIGGFVQ